MKLLVTGGAGFIGSNFILYWMSQYPEDVIVNLDKLTYAGNLENLLSLRDNNRYHFIHGDICDTDAVEKAMNGVDVVVHFAAESHVDRSIRKSVPFVKTNIVGTHTLLETALRYNIKRFHHVSTDEVYGSLALESTDAFNENSRYDPRSPYSASKAGSDFLVLAYFHTYGLPITLSNCSNNFGPYQFPEKLIPLVITNCIEGKKIPLYGDGLNVRDWLYVGDHVRAIDDILTKGKVGETYCIGGSAGELSNLQVVRKILASMNADESSIQFVADRKGHDRKYAINWQKIRKELGWKPRHDFDTWLTKTIKWYTDNKSWWQHIKSGEYQEYYQKQYGGASK